MPFASQRAGFALFLTALFVLAWSDAARADGAALTSIEAAWSLYNPDWEERHNAGGISLLARASLAQRVHAIASINLLSTDRVDLPVTSVRGLPFRNWHAVGAGYQWPLPGNLTVETTLSIQGVEIDGNMERGPGVALALAGVARERVQWRIEAGWIDVAIQDTTLIAQAAFALNRALAVTARIADYAKWDYTRYELGLRMRF